MHSRGALYNTNIYFHINNSLGDLSTLMILMWFTSSWHRMRCATRAARPKDSEKLERASAEEKSQASEQEALEKEKEAKEAGSTEQKPGSGRTKAKNI